MNPFPVKDIAKEWAAKFGGTDGCEEKAYICGVKYALEYAMSVCNSGSTPAMIRRYLYNRIAEIDGKEKA